MYRKNKVCLWRLHLIVCVVIIFSHVVRSEILSIPKIDTPPIIDGDLEEEIWKKAIIFTDFKTLHPQPGLMPSEKTEVYMVYDREKIYIGFRCFDSEPQKIMAHSSIRDNPGRDDWIAFCLDTHNDEIHAYFFLVNPLGVQSDGTLNMDGNPSVTANRQWQSAVKHTQEGYSAEMAIPFWELSYPWNEDLVMGFKVARFISRKGEEVDFPEILPDRDIHLSQFQKIRLSGIVKSPIRDHNAIPNLQARYRQKRELGTQFDTHTLDGRCRAWGDAAVIDYLLFPYHELKKGKEIFRFNKDIRADYVFARFETEEFGPGKRIENFEQFLTRTQTAAFIVVLNDTIIYENYFNGYGRDSIVTSFSVAKSFASTLVGIAIEEGHIGSVKDPITKYIPELKNRDTRFSRIRIQDLLMMSSGIRYEEDHPYRDDEITYYHPDLRKAALEETEIVGDQGAYFLYNNYNPLLIGMILERTTGMSVSEYFQEKLWVPLGMEYDGSWSTDSEQTRFEKMESGINARAIDFAKFGRLFLNDGRWGDEQIISSRWVEEATQPKEREAGYYPSWHFFSSQGGYYKYFWWGRKRGNGKSDFFGLGNKGQYIYIAPQKNLIIVRNGIEYGVSSMTWVRLFFDFASQIQ